MNIAMFTNTFIPHVGGVANSVKIFSDGFRKCGHRVLVIAPKYHHMPSHEKDVIRVPSIKNFNGTGFSVGLPSVRILQEKLKFFKPNIIHSHHPFFLGDTALRMAAAFNVPLVFTYHTMYEYYTHYIPGKIQFRDFVIQLASSYANACDAVIAPSESVAFILKKRGVGTPATIIPTGIDVDLYSHGNEDSFRAHMGIPADAFVVGYLGRLAPEKNLTFWASAVSEFVQQFPKGHVLIIGTGPCKEEIEAIFLRSEVRDHLHIDGVLSREKLLSAYQAMDVFVFTSKTETQGMVLAEAMASGVPVIALNAPGAREVVKDTINGRLLGEEKKEAFIEALFWVALMDVQKKQLLQKEAKSTAGRFSIDHSLQQILDLYQDLLKEKEKYTLRRGSEQSGGFSLPGRGEKKKRSIWRHRFQVLQKIFFNGTTY